MNGTRVARNLSAAAVAGIAAAASYTHMRQLALTYGQTSLLAALLPLSVDGLVIVGAVAMADDKRAGSPVRWSARVAFTVGVVASILANIVATPGGAVARIVSAWPAVSLLLVTEVLSRPARAAAATQVVPPVVAEVPPVVAAEVPVVPAAAAPVPVPMPAPEVPALAAESVPAGVALTRSTGGTPRAEATTEARTAVRRPAPRTGQRWTTHALREAAAALMAENPRMLRTEIAAKLDVTPRRLRQALQTA